MSVQPLSPRSRTSIIEEVRGRFGPIIRGASAPGRADFLNTHQDYKGLPVVPVAVNLRTYAFAVGELPEGFEVISLNLEREGAEFVDRFSLKPSLRGGRWFGDYLRSVVIALWDSGIKVGRGLRVVIDSDVPIGGGLGSSAALEVSFLKLLDTYYGLDLDRRSLAEIAFKAENEIMGIPCGRLDQYGSSYGGAILLYTRPPYRVEELPLGGVHLVIADSGIRHSVADIHPRRQAEIELGLKQLLEMEELPQKLRRLLGLRYWEPRWEELRLSDLEPYLDRIDEVAAKRLRFTLLMHESTLLALRLLKGEPLSRGELENLGVDVNATHLEVLGAVMNRQHELLRDLYEVSLPELEELRESMLEAGAYGVKISGAGLGGALIALVDRDASRRVAVAALEAGASNAWIVRVDEGAREELVS